MRQKSMVKIGNDWDELLVEEFNKDYYLRLRDFLKSEYSTRTIYPDMHDIFNALKSTPYSKVKAIFDSVELGTPVIVYHS